MFNLYSCFLPPIDFYDTNVRALTWRDEDVSMKAKENVCYEKKILYNDALHASCVPTFGQTLEFMTALVLVWSLLQKTDGYNVAGHPKAGGDTGE